MPFTPGVDFAGTVVETGPTVKHFEAGDSVYGTGMGNGAFQGSYADTRRYRPIASFTSPTVST